MTERRPREDLFVSLCVADPEGDVAACVEGLTKLADRLSEQFRYWEILLGVPVEASEDYSSLTRSIANIRLLKLRAGTPFYRRRVAVASEAIGDVVVVTSPSEFGMVDPLAALTLASETGTIVVGRAGQPTALGHALRALGHGAGYRVDARDMRTVAYPRTLLNRLLAHPDRTLAMRFPPADGAIPVRWLNASGKRARRSSSVRGLAHRLGLMHKLLIASAPRVLSGLAILSLLVVAASVAYCTYAVVVWLSFKEVQPGWLTTSVMSGMIAGFLGSAVFALAIGIQRLLDLLSADLSEEIVDEVAVVDLFGQAMRELNIEVAGELPRPPTDAANRAGAAVR